MTGHVKVLYNDQQRAIAKRIIEDAPLGSVVKVTPPGRTLDQNAKMQAMLSDVSIAKPRGLRMTPDQWKVVAMNECGFEQQFLNGWSDGLPFPAGYRSSRLSKAQMSDLIEWLYKMGAEEGVQWSEPEQ